MSEPARVSHDKEMLTGKEVTGVLGVQFLETRQENVREGTAVSSSDRRL